MRKWFWFAMILPVVALCAGTQDLSLDEYLEKARALAGAKDLEAACRVMEEALTGYGQDASAHAYMGQLLSMRAGQSQGDYQQAMQFVQQAFSHLDKALELDAANVTARLNRGILSIQLPSFFGRLNDGIADLQYLVNQPGQDKPSWLATAYFHLAQGFRKQQAFTKAIAATEHALALAGDGPLADYAAKQLKTLKELQAQAQVAAAPAQDAELTALQDTLAKEPASEEAACALANAYMARESWSKARTVLDKAAADIPDSVSIREMQLQVLQHLAEQGYTDAIREDTDYRSNLAFSVMHIMDQLVSLRPDNMEFRLARGELGITMPFFVGKLAPALADLELVAARGSTEQQAAALFMLGAGYRKKAQTHWLKLIKDHPGSPYAKRVFTESAADMVLSDAHTAQPGLTVEFLMSFLDELEPQTALWLTNGAGEFVKTLYVSGFAGYVRNVQVTLPQWANSSSFVDAQASTSASINQGQHVYTWDLTDHTGKQVAPGRYTLHLEVSFWPSMQYQYTSLDVDIGAEAGMYEKSDGKLVPKLRCLYVPLNGVAP